VVSNPSRLLSGTKDARHACDTPCESVLRLLHADVGILLSSQVRAALSPRKSGPLSIFGMLGGVFSTQKWALDTLRRVGAAFPPRNRGIHIKDDT
jgi:hypothetical protein